MNLTWRVPAAVLGAAAAWHLAPAVTALGPVRRAAAPALAGRSAFRHVALTFDDGPDPRSTPAFLEILAEHGVHATFFVLGRMAERFPETLELVASAGHEIGVHGWDHVCTVARSRRRLAADLLATATLIESRTGSAPVWYRPPYGVLSGSAVAAARDAGLTPILWTAWGRDWSARATAHTVIEAVGRGRAAGGTVLLHDSDCTSAPDAWRTTLQALPTLLAGWHADGIPVGTLAEHRVTQRGAESRPG